MAPRKNAAAQSLGRRRMSLLTTEEIAAMGSKGGKASLRTMTAEERKARAKAAGQASAKKRWGKKAPK